MIKRSTVNALAFGASALVGIATYEYYSSTVYIPVPGDVPTIGFGTTKGVKPGDKVTPTRALILLLKDAEESAQAVKRCAPVPMHQYEFDAYVSLTYNIGTNAFCKSTITKKLNAGDYDGACKEILRWNKMGGKELNGLTKRRQSEYKTCIGIA